jgi:hypothetical protein
VIEMNITRIARNLLTGAALATGLLLAATTPGAQAQVVVAAYAPPAIPVYEQPECPGDGYLWTPGYWAWGDGGYYWVEGAWVLPPYVGGLWTPGYWGWGAGGYLWRPGYWGLHIGYYGGINYGFGYFGVGFYGGYWNGGRFFYNRAYGHFGEGFRGGFYERRYAGFNGRPGGVAYARNEPGNFHENGIGRASTINGAGSRNTGSFNNARAGFGGNGAPQHTAPSYGGGRPTGSFGGGNYGGGRPSAPAGNFGGGHPSAPAGGGGHPSFSGGGGHVGGGGGHAGGGRH